MNEMGIQGLKVGEVDKLRNIGFVADIAFMVAVFVPPLLRGFTEQGHVEQIRLAGLDEIDLLGRQLRRDQDRLDGVGVDAVIDFGQVAADVPAELLEFLLFESLELLDH
jgi:hypothetical protein